MNIAIADDTPADRAELTELLARYFREKQLRSECAVFDSGEALLAAFAPGAFDLIFLDIYMGGMDGMETARRLRAADGAARLVFFTTSSSHAVESYTVRAAHYLTKPLDYQRLAQAMDAVCASLLKSSRCLRFRVSGVAAEVALADILYADCGLERLRLHLRDRVLPADDRAGPLLETLLADGRFLSCNRNVAVNMDFVAKVLEDSFLLQSGEAVPIRQRGRAGVKKEFLRYSLRALQKEDPS